MSTDTQNNAPDCPFPCGWQGLHKIAVQDAAYLAKVQWPEDEEGVSVPRATAMRCMDYLIQVCRTMLNAAPVAAQPDLTQQTLDDVMAGIPARDAEIEALRKQVGTLQAQLVDKSPETQGKPVDELPNLQAQQQPVIDADGLTQEAWEEWKSRAAIAQQVANIPAVDKALEVLCNEGTADNAVALVRAVMTAQAQLSGNPGQLDHLPDATKMVKLSGNSGELESFSAWANDYCEMHQHAPGKFSSKITEFAFMAWQARSALAQQDADRVDAALAEMVHAMFRSGNSVPVTRITIDRKQYDAAIDAARKELA